MTAVPDNKDDTPEELRQVIRWIPKKDNGGAGHLWRNFCAGSDAGPGNAPRTLAGGGINQDVVSMGRSSEETVKGTTTTWFTAHWHRAVFELKFKFKGKFNPPNQRNLWGLPANECWPRALAPNDPGYVLLTDDKWYQTVRPQHFDKGDYQLPKGPQKASKMAAYEQALTQRLDDADSRRRRYGLPVPNRPQKRDLSDFFDNEEDSGFVIRDLNATEKLTERDFDEEDDGLGFDIEKCADRECTLERRDLGENDVIVPGKAPPMTPVANVDTQPTIRPRDEVSNTLITKVRRAVSPDLPVKTGGY